MVKVYYSERPEDAEMLIVKDEAIVHFRENIQETEIVVDDSPESQHTETQWSADEYTLTMPATINIQERFEVNKEKWRAIAKERDYNKTATKIREQRNHLLDQTDKEMSIDRIISDVPNDSSSITAFLPFLKNFTSSLTGDMAKYRQALRDIPQ